MGSQNFEQLMNLYHGIFTYCGIGALVFLALAIALFVLLKIPRVFCELTGRNAKKAIQEMVAEGSATGNLTSRKIGEDGRRHRKKARTGALGTARLRRRTGSLTASLATERMAAEQAGSEQMSGGQMSGGQMSAGQMSAGQMAGGQMSVGQMAGGQMSVGQMVGGQNPPGDVLPTPGGRLDGFAAAAPGQGDGPGSDAVNDEDNGNETMVLGSAGGVDFFVLRSIVEIHTDEVIGG